MGDVEPYPVTLRWRSVKAAVSTLTLSAFGIMGIGAVVFGLFGPGLGASDRLLIGGVSLAFMSLGFGAVTKELLAGPTR